MKKKVRKRVILGRRANQGRAYKMKILDGRRDGKSDGQTDLSV